VRGKAGGARGEQGGGRGERGGARGEGTRGGRRREGGRMADKAMEEEARRELDSYLKKFEAFDKKIIAGVDPKWQPRTSMRTRLPLRDRRRRSDAKMAAAKRKARESKDKAQKGEWRHAQQHGHMSGAGVLHCYLPPKCKRSQICQ